MLFLQVSFDEYTGNHHTNTFFFLLSKMGHFQPQGQIFHSQIILDFRSLQPFFFFFCPFNALQWHKADVIIPDT